MMELAESIFLDFSIYVKTIGRAECLAGRPGQRSSTKHVHMKMKNRLARTGAGIYYRAIAVLIQAGSIRNLGRDSQQMTEQCFILLCSVIKRVEVLARNNQQVGGRLWIDIADYNRAIIFAYELRGNFPVDDATE
jgi:hypothetical protein